ncbi:tetratricopeptide repeat protein, partial [bacterium]|nr:tetratricopeptide repeat protein [bacterium]
MKEKTLVALVIVMVSQFAPVHAQEFVKGMRLFNRAEYDSLIHVFIPQFIKDHPEEEGLATFFLAESYYNKGIVESSKEKAASFFQRSYTEFQAASTSDEIRSNYPEYYNSALYKMGWCSYRLAELDHEPLAMLQRAYDHFAGLHTEAPDSIKLFSRYMAAKAGVRASLIQLRDPGNVLMDSSAYDLQVKRLTEIADLYDGILEYDGITSGSSHFLKLSEAVRFESLSLKFLIGKWHQLFSTHRSAKYTNLNDLEELAARAQANFQMIIESIDVRESSGEVLQRYYRMLASLNNYMLLGLDSARRTVLEKWSNIVSLEFEAEKMFRRANLHHSNPDVTSGDFNQLAPRYYKASVDIPESHYWLGYLQMIQNDSKDSRDNFEIFLEGRTDDSVVTQREQTLYEDAQLRKFLLDFEILYLSNRLKQLRQLAKEIQAFSPVNVEIQERKELVNLMVHASLIRNPSQLWSQVLIGTDDEKLSRALNTITFILPRAALNIGSTREKYLTLLGRLFEVTKIKRSDETLFFRGIAKSLEAEIQASPIEKSRIYLEAANILKTVRSGYINKGEAEYLRARCLFFADEFDQAEALLHRLVNERHSLRALFYLAETHRYNGQGLAAKKCYQAIVDKSKNAKHEFDKYWLLNAKAGLEASNDEGDLTPLAININDVRFQSNSHLNQLTYERLADERLLQQRLARESVEWLMHYGLPKKEIYLSKHRLANSIFIAANVFENSPYSLDEVRGPVTSDFKLMVAVPDGSTGESTVMLGSETIPASDGAYIRKRLGLNSEHELTVFHVESYAHTRRVKLRRAGENVEAVVLSKRVNFSPSGKVNSMFDEAYPFQARWDRNVIFNDAIPEQSADSELVRDFSSRYELRDCTIDKNQNRILTVNAIENSVWIYSTESNSKRIGVMRLSLPSSLSSPEG